MSKRQVDNFDSEVMILRKILGNQPEIAVGATASPVTVTPAQTSSAPSSSSPSTTASDVSIPAGNRLYVHNLSTTPLYVLRGSGATTSNFNYALRAGAAADDGTGGIVTIDDYTGPVSFASATVRYIAWIR